MSRAQDHAAARELMHFDWPWRIKMWRWIPQEVAHEAAC